MKTFGLIVSLTALCVEAVQRPAAGLLREASARPPAAQRCAEKGKSCQVKHKTLHFSCTDLTFKFWFHT